MQLREDGVPSLIQSALRIGLSTPQVQALLADNGFDWTLETVRKKIRALEVQAEGVDHTQSWRGLPTDG